MPYVVTVPDAKQMFPEYTFVTALTPSEQKAAFHVQDKNGRDFCLKIIAPNFSVNRLEREIIALQSINHPNIVKLIEYTFSSRPGQQRHYIIEEFIDGSDLSNLVGNGKRFDLQSAVQVFSQICDGLAELQKQSVVHRDLKPSNIRVRPDSAPVIIDFGLARLLKLNDLTRTGDGAAIGTPRYFAPEQFKGTKHDIDHRTDLFATGVLLYEALIGHHPFYQQGMCYDNLEEAVCVSESHWSDANFDALPKGWRLLLKKLLAKDRGGRPHNAGQVAAILRKIGSQ